MTVSTQDPLSGRLSSSSWPRPALERDQPAIAATVAILESLFAVMLENEEGVHLDVDPERLHDFRVAVRRTRSALGQIHDVLPQAEVLRFRQEFSWLQGATGRSRDLDVFLLELSAYAAALPSSLAPGLALVRESIERRRESAHRQLVTELASERFRSLRREWPSFLSAAATDDAAAAAEPANARRPIAEVAEERISRAHRRASERARKIEVASSDRDLHRLRIAFKKLRYLLEFFSSLDRSEEATGQIDSLKALQDELGELNDLSVQRAVLRELGAGPSLESSSASASAAAARELDELLAELQHGARERLVRSLEPYLLGRADRALE